MTGARPRLLARADLLCLILCFVVGLAVRLTFQAAYRDAIEVDSRNLRNLDTATFDRWARGIAAGDLLSARFTPPTDHWWTRRIADADAWDAWLPEGRFHQSPLYPYLVAAAYRMFGTGARVIPTIQALLGAFSVALTFLLTRRHGGRVAAVGAGLLLALTGPSVFYTQFLLRATLLEFLAVAFLLSLDLASGSRKARAFGGLGALAAVSVLAKPVFAFFLPLALLAPWLRSSAAERSIRFFSRSYLGKVALPVFLGFVVPLAPLVARNAAVGAPLLSLSTRGPAAFLNGNASASDGTEWFPERTRVELLDVQTRGILEEVGWNLGPVIVETLKTHRDHPTGYPALVGRKVLALLRGDEPANNVDYSSTRILVPLLGALPDFRFLGALFLCGLGLSLSCWRRRAHLIAFVLVYGLITVAFFVIGRFRVPLLPAAAVFGGLALEGLFGFLRRPATGRGSLSSPAPTARIAVAWILLGLGLFVSWPRATPPTEVKARYDLAYRVAEEARSLAGSDPARAVAKFERAAKTFEEIAGGPEDPENPLLRISARSQVGRVYLEHLGRLAEAERRFFEVLAELESREENLKILLAKQNVHASLGSLYMSRYRADPSRSDLADRARKEYELASALGARARARSSLDVELLATAAWIECVLATFALHPGDDLERAERHYRNALEIAPGYSGAVYGLGRLRVVRSRGKPLDEVRGELEQARVDLLKARRADPLPDAPEQIDELIREVEARLDGARG